MKTADAIAKAGSATRLASLFEITHSAVSQWGEELPEARVWQLRVLRPDWFEAPIVVTPDYTGPDRRTSTRA